MLAVRAGATGALETGIESPFTIELVVATLATHASCAAVAAAVDIALRPVLDAIKAGWSAAPQGIAPKGCAVRVGNTRLIEGAAATGPSAVGRGLVHVLLRVATVVWGADGRSPSHGDAGHVPETLTADAVVVVVSAEFAAGAGIASASTIHVAFVTVSASAVTEAHDADTRVADIA